MDEESDEIPRDNLEELKNMLRHRIARGKIHLLKRDDLKGLNEGLLISAQAFP